MLNKIYSFIRRVTPTKWHGLFTSMLYDLGIKPTVNHTVKSPFSKGIIVISADFEMAWAFRYSKTKGPIAEELGLRERENVPKILALFDKYKIPITWATVGHLFLESCSKATGQNPHPNMPRHTFFENKNWKFSHGDWYQHDPCSNYKDSPAWYAPDLIDQIIKSPVGHEIGCHTFSHIDCTDKNCTPELLNAELNECVKEAQKKGIQLKSIVFPGGTNGNYEVLKNAGFKCYRKSTNFHIDIPVLDKHGLVQIPSSYNLDRSNLNWTAKRYIRMANSFVKKASKHKMVAHLWFHPSLDKWYIENVMPFVLENINREVREGRVEVYTMDKLAERFFQQTDL